MFEGSLKKRYWLYETNCSTVICVLRQKPFAVLEQSLPFDFSYDVPGSHECARSTDLPRSGRKSTADPRPAQIRTLGSAFRTYFVSDRYYRSRNVRSSASERKAFLRPHYAPPTPTRARRPMFIGTAAGYL